MRYISVLTKPWQIDKPLTFDLLMHLEIGKECHVHKCY